jgi:ATP-dependent Zn protease
MYVGVGAKRIRDLFAQARTLAPCIIFIDEIDGIGSKRNLHHQEQNSDSERSTTLNQLLTELDGFKESENIVLIGATNRFTLLDDALLRSGRFDTKIKLDLPNVKDRAGILSLHLNKVCCRDVLSVP